jgi:glutathione S-transferase
MKPILYSSINCPHSAKTAFFLAEKGIAFQRVEVSLAQNIQKTPAYLAINPKGTVPAFEDENGILVDSLDIMQYVDEQRDTQRLFPADPEELQTTVEWIDRASTDFWDVSHHLYWQTIEPPAEGTDWDEVKRLKAKGISLLQELENILSEQPYICGEFSVVDIVVLPWVYGYQRFDLPEPNQFPHVEAWRDKLADRRTFQDNRNQEGVSFQTFLETKSK